MVGQWALVLAPTGDPLEAVVAMPPGSFKDLGPCAGITRSASETRSKDGPGAWKIPDCGQFPCTATFQRRLKGY